MDPEMIIKQVAPQPMLSRRATTSLAELGQVMGDLLGEISAAMEKQGIEPAGPPFTIYHSMQDERSIEIETGIPVARPVAGTGSILAGTLPGGRVVTTTHLGPYEMLPNTHQALFAWVQEQGVEPTGPFWESYVTDPGEEPNTMLWRTELVWPIA